MPRIPALEHLRNRVVVNPLETALEEDLNVSCCCRWKSMFTYLVPGADFLSCFAFTRCLTELFMDLFQFGQVQITKDKLDVECVDSLLEPDHHILNSPLAGMPTPKTLTEN